jgi:hypothetical protein
MVRTGPGDSLNADDTFFSNGRRVMSQYQARGSRYIGGEAGDGKVLVIEFRIGEENV